jgi:hypothetical protein
MLPQEVCNYFLVAPEEDHRDRCILGPEQIVGYVFSRAPQDGRIVYLTQDVSFSDNS